MSLIDIKCDVDGAVAQIRALQEDQLPFIIAKSLTVVAQVAQKAVRVREGQVFKLRNDWTTKNTKITPATKQSLTSQVYTDTGNKSAPDYLNPQESGGNKEHHQGNKYFAIPTRYLRAIQPYTIPAPMRPYNLLPLDSQIGQAYPGRLELISVDKRSQFGRVSARKLKKLGTTRYIAFKQYDKNGTLCIFVRLDGQRDAQPWYVLVTHANLKPKLKMQQTVEDVVAQEFPEIFYTVVDEALKSSFRL